ncbi:MAG: NAD(P)H-binding protein [Pseudomonadota bacterium]
MNVLLFGATGMVGQGVLRECLASVQVDSVVTIGRTPTGQSHAKLRELAHQDMWDYTQIESALSNFDACFFCLGGTASGMSEAEYSRCTYDLTVAAATVLARRNPQMTFVYVSGVGADSSEKGAVMWARIRGKTENALLRLPFKAAYMFRPGMIQPLHGIRSKTKALRIFYSIVKPVLPLMRMLFPQRILTTSVIGQAMLAVATRGAAKRVLESADINALVTTKIR